MVSMINKPRQVNVKPDSPEFPIVQSEKWDKREQVTGVKRDAAIQVIGAVVLRVGLLQVTGKAGPSILVRAKVFEKGASEFQGLILGGRALDCEANGGLGFRPVARAFMQGLFPSSCRHNVAELEPDCNTLLNQLNLTGLGLVAADGRQLQGSTALPD